MAESYSVNAVLSAADKGFTSTLKNALGTTQTLADKIKGGFAFGVLSGVGQQAFSALANGARSLIGDINSSNVAWKTFAGNMEIMGKGKGEIKAVKQELQAFAEASIYNSSDMASTYAQLAAVGTKNTTQLVKGFGGLAAAAEDPKQAMKTLSQQATQMAAKPAVAWQDFKLMLDQTPAGVAAVAKEMGMSAQEMVTNVQDGKISTEAFFDAIQKVGTSDSFTKLATEYKDAGQAMGGLTETLGNKLGPAFEVLSTTAISGIEGIIGVISQIDGEALATKISAGIEAAKPYWEAFKDVVGQVGKVLQRVGGFFLQHAGAISKCIPYVLGGVAAFKAFGFLKSFNPFARFKKNVEDATGGAARAVGKSKSTIAQIINSLGGVLKSAGSAIKDMFLGIGTVAKGIGVGLKAALQGVAPAAKGIGVGLKAALQGVAPAAKGIGAGLQSAFKGIGAALKTANPVNILALGAAVGIVVAAFALLATQGEGIAAILESIGTIIGTVISAVITSFAEALMILAPILPIIAQSLVTLSPLVTAFGAALSSVAVAVGEAVSRIITAVTPIVEIIGNVFTQAVQIVSGAVVGIIQAVAPVLPAITEAFTAVVSTISGAVVQIVQAVAPYMPEMQKMVEATSRAIQAICDAFTKLVGQIAPIVQSVTELIKRLGETIVDILQGASEIIKSVSDGIIGVIESIGTAISGVLDSLAGIFESLGNAALNAGKGFEALARGIKTITGLNLLDMGASLGAVALGIGGIVLASGGLSEIGTGMSLLANGLLGVSANGAAASVAMTGIAGAATALVPCLMALPSAMLNAGAAYLTFAANTTSAAAGVGTFGAASLALHSGILALSAILLVAGAGMTGISQKAKSAESSLNSIKSAVDIVEAGLDVLGGVAKKAMDTICKAFNDTAKKAKIAGVDVGKGFSQGMQGELAKGPSIVVVNMGLILAALRSGRSGAYSAGAYISQGFAHGMLSCLGLIRNAAAQMAVAADAAVRAKARIHSPSKVSDKLGTYWGQGWVGGILGMVKEAWSAAKKLVSVPDVAVPKLAMSYAGGVDGEYEYYRNAEYTIVVPLVMDGRELARSTVRYTQEELNKQQVRDSRKHGKV